MSVGEMLSDVADGRESVTRRSRWNSMSTGQRDRLKQFLLDDSYAFTFIICGHTDLVPELHMPLSYMVCGLTDKLAASLNQSGFDSYVTRKIRRELFARGINWRTPEGFAALADQLDNLNIRWFRGSYKSSVCTHGGALFIATRDPNETIKITHAVDPKAWEFCAQIGKTVLSGTYRDLFPERIPVGDLDKKITMKRIELGGRTISHPQTTIQAMGYTTKDTSAHYSTFLFDDLVVGGPGGNNTPAELPNVHAHLRGLTGYYMNTRRIRRIHVGTKWAEDDDDYFLTSGNRAKTFLTIRVPIEEHSEGYVENILQRGTPTIPQLADTKRIQAIQDATLDPEKGLDGALEWRCNYLLDVTAGGARVFPHHLVHDPERSWLRLPHPKAGKGVDSDRFLVSRYVRDVEGNKVAREKWEGADDDPARFLWRTYDPMRELDRVLTIDPSWVESGGDNWAVSATGDDHENVRFQLETLSGDDGLDGWIDAAVYMAEVWRPRVIGFDANAYQDAAVANIIKNDRRLRRIRHLFVPIKAHNVSKQSRIKQCVAERLKMYRFLWNPDDTEAKDEAVKYRGDKNAVDGILDSLAMAEAVHVKKSSKEERETRMAGLLARRAAIERAIDPYTGIPYAA